MTKLTRLAVEGLGPERRRRATAAATSSRWAWCTGCTTGRWSRRCGTSTRSSARSRRSPQANTAALKAGYNYGETAEAFTTQYHVPQGQARRPASTRNIIGNTALAWGLMTAAKLSGKRLFLGAYPITPASDILHELSELQELRRAHVPGRGRDRRDDRRRSAPRSPATMAVTASSGPGIALKGEGIGLAVMTELPMMIINVQRGGPSTGLPTKTEQADLLQAMFGRNGECPMPVIAARSPADCFDVAQEAWRIAVRFMTPVMLLTDGYIANGSEPWRIPEVRRAAEDRDQASRSAVERRRRSCRTSATSGWPGRGPFPARRAWSTASAAWKSRTSPAT